MHRFLKDKINWKEKGFILGTNHIVYLKPLFLFDEVHIYTGVGKIGNSSVTFISLITNGKEPVAVAYSVLVAYNFIEDKSILVPGEWREVFLNVDRRLLSFIEKNQPEL
jgi:acyl-CoA thioesterase FadM